MMCSQSLRMEGFSKCTEKEDLLLILVDLCRDKRANAVEKVVVLQNK